MAFDFSKVNNLFDEVIAHYHFYDSVDTPIENSYSGETLKALLYEKCWIDTVQWHLEDIVRDRSLPPELGMEVKHRIDASNQKRTDKVEAIDDYFLHLFSQVVLAPEADLNTETPGWVLDRLSILALKIWHMREQSEREEVEPEHRTICQAKLETLLEQRTDLTASFLKLLHDLQSGKKRMKLYKQMKLYNNPQTNPALYGKS